MLLPLSERKWPVMLGRVFRAAQIVQRLVAEVDAVSDAMLAGLLAKLGGPIQLPECLRVVGCLRRLAPFPEAELRTRHVLAGSAAWEAVSEPATQAGHR